MDCDNQEIEATKNMKEKTADEMFDELGLEKIHDNGRHIVYTYGFDKNIEFKIKQKWVGADIWLNMKELQAINKKCEELRLDLRKRGNYNVKNKR